jgi:AraC-type DNA-binding domain-containing proteins
MNYIDIAIKFDFESGDSFLRSFKRATGFLPSEYRKQNKILFIFERIDINAVMKSKLKYC